MEIAIRRLRESIGSSSHIVGFTGAGVSTESGIPDYRSQGGIWDRFQPITFQEFISVENKRILYRQRKWEMWPSIASALPGPGHRFFASLDAAGSLDGVITQNIDGLHERSGLPSDRIVNLHGSALTTSCLECEYSMSSSDLYQHHNLADGVPTCPKCGGLLKPSTISFGQNLDQDSIARAKSLAEGCDLMIAMGSTLIVHPAASIPLVAKRNGALLVIVTLSETPLDDEADIVINRSIGEVVEALDIDVDSGTIA